MLSAEGLTVGYEARDVLAGLDVTVPEGRFTVIIGPNACGKSTLLRSLARLLKPRGGTVRLDGVPVDEQSPRHVATRMAVLPQTPLVPEGVTVAELVGRGRSPYQRWYRQWTVEDTEAVATAMRSADVAELADRPVAALSGGQRQRVWIAMTLAQQTPILLLDEPTTYLDPAHQLEILTLLGRLRDEGKTVVAVLHDLNQAARYADHVIAMRDGQIVEAGTPRDVIDADLVARVFGMDCVVVPCPVSGAPLVVPL